MKKIGNVTIYDDHDKNTNRIKNLAGFIGLVLVVTAIAGAFYLAIVIQERIELAQSIWCVNAGVCDD